MKNSTSPPWWALIRTFAVLLFFTHWPSHAQVQDTQFDAQENTDINTSTEGESIDFVPSEKLEMTDQQTISAALNHVHLVAAVQDNLSCKPESHYNVFLNAILSGPTSKCYSNHTIVSYVVDKANNPIKKPKCTEEEGCDVPLNCFNYSSLTDNVSIVPDPPQAVSVTPLQLEQIIENPSIENNCVLVMFYAPWCEFSAKFARRYNTVGRTFKEFPVLAVDLCENEPHKYVLAYLPVVAFYHRSKVIYRFKLTETIEELRDMIVKMTGFNPLDVSLTDKENEHPVPVVRSNEETPFLYISVIWIMFVLLVYIARSSYVSYCLSFFINKLQAIRTA